MPNDPNASAQPSTTAQLTEAEREKLIAYLDGELDEAAEHEVEVELGQRESIRQEADVLRKTWDLLDFLPKVNPPPQFTAQTMQRLEMTKLRLIHREQLWRRLAMVGWILTVLLVASMAFTLAYYWPLSPRQAQLHETRPQSSSASSPQPSQHGADVPYFEPPILRMEGMNRNQERTLLNWIYQDIYRVREELMTKLEPFEKRRLQEATRQGGLVFVEALLELANKYKVPIQRPFVPPGKPNLPREREPLGSDPKKNTKPTRTDTRPEALGHNRPATLLL